MKPILFFSCLLTFILSTSGAEARKEVLSPGLEYESLIGDTIHLFRIDLQQYSLTLAEAKDFGKGNLTADEFREKTKSTLAINGSYFDDLGQTMGLLVRDGKQLHPLRNNSWAIFLLSSISGKPHRPEITTRSEWSHILNRPKSLVKMAIQTGPRLIVGGQLSQFKETGIARRSAIGITRQGWIEIGLSEAGIYLKEWAEIMKRDCNEAINLDGGGSSQLSLSHPAKSLTIGGLTTVPNVILVQALKK